MTVALAGAMMMISAGRAESAEEERYRLPWDDSETWQISRGPSASGSHGSSNGFSAWDFFPVSLDEGIHTLAVADGTASVFCDDGNQAHVRLVTDAGGVFNYAHLDSESVNSAGITNGGRRVMQGQSLGTLFHDTDGYSLPCGSGTGPHLHFEIKTSQLPVVIDGYSFSLTQQHTGEQLDSSNNVGGILPTEQVSTPSLSVNGANWYYDVTTTGRLNGVIKSGSYAAGWDHITPIDLDGDGTDELMFYFDTGAYWYYDVTTTGRLNGVIKSGSYAAGWDHITPIDLDGDGTDELMFYFDTGAYWYYDVTTTGQLNGVIKSGSYAAGWDHITPIDLDGDGTDELMFYFDTGAYWYYDVTTTGQLNGVIKSGSYAAGWDHITPIDLDGDGTNELMFYFDTGAYWYYDVTTTGKLNGVIKSGSYAAWWDHITPIDLDGDGTNELMFYGRPV